MINAENSTEVAAQTPLSELFADLPRIDNPQCDLPRFARDSELMKNIEARLRSYSTHHNLYLGDSRHMDFLQPASVHLAVTSPPYWDLKRYRDTEGQLGHIEDYAEFLEQLDQVWRHCYRALVPGGRLACVVGDVCRSRRQHGKHEVIPLHAAIQDRCRDIGFDNLTPVIWHKIANVACESRRKSAFLGKPYEPNAIIKNDLEFILLFRKPGGYRRASLETRIGSLISQENHRAWFRAIWNDVPGATGKNHPAPFPEKLAERLIRMFSFVGDTVLDPFLGTGTTTVAAAASGRHSVGVELDPVYFESAVDRVAGSLRDLPSDSRLEIHRVQ